MAHERKDEEQDYRKINPTDTNTGLGHGVSSMGGVPAGGGAMAGENDGTTTESVPLGSRDTDTGLPIGIGQGTSTGTLPTDGGPDLSGTGIAENSGVLSGQGYEPPYGHTQGDITDPRSDRDRESRYDQHDPAERPEDNAKEQ